jgi:hypothetical protein
MVARRDVTAPAQDSAGIVQAQRLDALPEERPCAREIFVPLVERRLASQPQAQPPQGVALQEMWDGPAPRREQPVAPDLELSKVPGRRQAWPQSVLLVPQQQARLQA